MQPHWLRSFFDEQVGGPAQIFLFLCDCADQPDIAETTLLEWLLRLNLSELNLGVDAVLSLHLPQVHLVAGRPDSLPVIKYFPVVSEQVLLVLARELGE